MCGIAGAVGVAPGLVSSREVEVSTTAIAHRGPDDWGVWSDDFCALGHRRLSIIDLSPAGHQPMCTEDGNLYITFNGEIYNFQSLREELRGLGHRFRTGTDTEVILNAYRQWGADCLGRLRGMFAFGIWDRTAHRLFLARDRVGKKPIFYTQIGARFYFSSELQGILSNPDVPRRPDLAAINEYLSFGYIPAPSTGFSGIFKLPAAHFLLLEPQGDGFRQQIQGYWTLRYEPKQDLHEQEAAGEIRRLLTESVKLRMISDVPLGAFLSGGIDSSVVVGLMAGLSSKPVKTFSIAFRDEAYNEAQYAAIIARKWNTEHTEFMVEPNAMEILPTLVRHYGEPYADSSAVPTYYVSKLTRQHVTVALTGDGGDENFAGYDRYRANQLAERMSRFPGMRWLASGVSSMLPDSLDYRSRLRRMKRFLAVASEDMAKRYLHWITFYSTAEKQTLLTEEFKRESSPEGSDAWLAGLFAEARGLGPVEAAMAVDIVSYLPYDLLVKTDIATMISALEARCPFLDHVFMEFVAQLPLSFKLKGGCSKFLLKKTFPDLLPPEIVNRPKRGFGVPIGSWFRGPLAPMLKETLAPEAMQRRGLLQPAHVETLVREHTSGQRDHGYRLWNLLMLELWFREFIDASAAKASAA